MSFVKDLTALPLLGLQPRSPSHSIITSSFYLPQPLPAFDPHLALATITSVLYLTNYLVTSTYICHRSSVRLK